MCHPQTHYARNFRRTHIVPSLLQSGIRWKIVESSAVCIHYHPTEQRSNEPTIPLEPKRHLHTALEESLQFGAILNFRMF